MTTTPTWITPGARALIDTALNRTTQGPQFMSVTVDRLTKTQVVVKDAQGKESRFRLDTLRAVGQGDTWHPVTLVNPNNADVFRRYLADQERIVRLNAKNKVTALMVRFAQGEDTAAAEATALIETATERITKIREQVERLG